MDRIEFCPSSKIEILTTISKVAVEVPSSTVVFGENNTLHDLRMGAFYNMVCMTCQKGHRECPGHFGHCELVVPVVNPNFHKPILNAILRSFCGACKKATTVGVVDEEGARCRCARGKSFHYNTVTHRRVAAAAGGGGGKRGRKRKRDAAENCDDGDDTIISELLDTATKRAGVRYRFTHGQTGAAVSLRSIYEFVASIERSVYLKVFPKYERYADLSDVCFIHLLPVLPITGRYPNLTNDVWYPHHITLLYTSIMKKNIQLKAALLQKNLHSGLVDEFVSELQDAVNILFDVKNTGRALRKKVVEAGSLRQMIDGKQGRIRCNLMGKRVEFSSRTVLSGDPVLKINEVGLPRSVCEHLTIPFVINDYNVSEMRSSWNIRYIVKRSTGQRFDASLMDRERVLRLVEKGDTVERSLRNGDLVVVNRQPSLHRASMMALYVRIFDCNTIRLSYNSLAGLAADCDGDELNCHVPQDHQSRAELEELFLMSTSIVSSQGSKPLLGLTQDSLLGVYVMSKTLVTENDFLDILYKAGLSCAEVPGPCVLKPRRMYQGIQFVNAVLLELGIYLGHSYDHGGVVMRNGEILSGVFTKATLGIADRSLVHLVYLRYGHLKAADFMYYVQRVADHFLDKHGFSVGIGDCIVDHRPVDHRMVDDYIRDCIETKGQLPDEEKLCGALNTLTQIPCTDESVHANNSLLSMINAGSKGSIVNFNQITRMLGQQFSAQGRLRPEIAKDTRTLPHFSKFDYSLASRGFVQSSFVKGLSPIEFWNHSKPSRITMIDTACKTSVTGAQQRRLVKSLEKLIAEDAGDGQRCVKDMSTGQVVQFQYGEDGLDGTFMVNSND